MLITVTRDADIRNWCGQQQSQASSWGRIEYPPNGTQAEATTQIKALLALVGVSEPLCVTGHGNDQEIGDKEVDGWGWDANDFAQLLGRSLPSGYAGVILIRSCAASVSSFAALVTVALEKLNLLSGVWIYGYQKAVDVTHPFPDPTKLDKNVELYGHRVGARTAARALDPRAAATPTPIPWPPRAVTPPPAFAAAFNQPAVKNYVVNETGNIMLSTTATGTPSIDPKVASTFEEVAVFFAAMTKAITSTPKPNAKPPYSAADYYTIYDYVALEGIVNRSGLFVNVHREDLQIFKKEVTATFNIEFIEAVLGVALTDGIGAEALIASLNSMGKQASISYNRSGSSDKIANILFVCEYLFGLPIVNALYFYMDEDEVQSVIEASPCVTVSSESITITVHKDTFLFVLPDWIQKYAGRLDSVAASPDFQQLVTELQSYISDTPMILGVEDGGGTVTALKEGQSYTLRGENLGDTAGALSIAGTAQTVASGPTGWTHESVSFTAVKPPNSGPETGGPIVLTTAAKPAGVATSRDDYSFGS